MPRCVLPLMRLPVQSKESVDAFLLCSSATRAGRTRDLLDGKGGFWVQFQSSYGVVTGTVKAVGGRLLAVGNAVAAGVGVWECLWATVRAGVLGWTPPPPFKRLSVCDPCCVP